MFSRAFLNLGLLLVVVGLAVYAFTDDGPQPSEQPALLETDGTPEITRVRIERTGENAVELAKVDGQWQLQAPIKWPANSFRVKALLDVRRTPTFGSWPAAAPDLPRYNLAPPLARLFLDQTEIRFGDTEPLNQRRYLQVGDTVYVSEDRAYHNIAGAPAVLMHPAILGPAARPVSIELPGVRIWQEDGRWVTQPERKDLGADDLNAFADAWQQAQSTSVQAKPAGFQGSSTVVVTLEGRDEPLRFDVKQTKYEVLLSRDALGVQYHLPRSAAEKLLQVKAPTKKKKP